MGLFDNIFGGGGGGGSSQSSTTTSTDNRLGVGGDANAPIAGTRGVQANAAGSIAAQGGVKISTTDQRNFGNQVGKVGNNSNVNIVSADPEVAKAALAAQLYAQKDALDTVQATTSQAFGFGQSTLDAFNAMDERRSQAVSQTINAATDQAREAAARSESVVQSALSKLADQRAPDGSNVVKIVLYIALAAAAVLALSVWRRR